MYGLGVKLWGRHDLDYNRSVCFFMKKIALAIDTTHIEYAETHCCWGMERKRVLLDLEILK